MTVDETLQAAIVNVTAQLNVPGVLQVTPTEFDITSDVNLLNSSGTDYALNITNATLGGGTYQGATSLSADSLILLRTESGVTKSLLLEAAQSQFDGRLLVGEELQVGTDLVVNDNGV